MAAESESCYSSNLQQVRTSDLTFVGMTSKKRLNPPDR